jgi:two-component system, LytTR family, response regulator
MPAETKIRILVADDEPLARRGVRQLLAPHRDMVVAGESRNGPETLRALEALAPDLLFLDIQMPEMDGFEVLRVWGPERMPAVIFVTAHDRFAVRAFETHALDYLVKPLKIDRFDAALERMRERVRMALQMTEAVDRGTRLAALLAAERAQREKSGIERLVVPTPTGDLVIPAAEIDWIAADDYYARLHIGAKDYLLRESLSALEARLDARRFLRIHRSAIVQLDRVRELRTGLEGEEVVLSNGACIPVSRRRRAALESALRYRGVRA